MLIIFLITFILHMNFVRCFTNSMIISENSVIRKAIINDNMPSLYTSFNFNKMPKNRFYTAEHIYPQSYLSDTECKDMHNIIKTINSINVNRSNYKFHDYIDITDKNWKKIEFDNYVNHKLKLFVPNSNSRGFISRAILYMCREYNLKIDKIIDKGTLIKWFYSYSPTSREIYHNDMIKKVQNNNNIFISRYNKKNFCFKKYIEKL